VVFVVTVGEIDLAFPRPWALAWIFALLCQAGYDRPRIVAAIIVACCLASVSVRSWSMPASPRYRDLGMNYMLRGLILILTQGKSIALLTLRDSSAYTIFSSSIAGIPVQIFWALAFVIFLRHPL